MNTFTGAHELEKARGRVLRLYGQQKITKTQHEVGLQLIALLGRVLVDPIRAETARVALADVQYIFPEENGDNNGTHTASN